MTFCGMQDFLLHALTSSSVELHTQYALAVQHKTGIVHDHDQACYEQALRLNFMPHKQGHMIHASQTRPHDGLFASPGELRQTTQRTVISMLPFSYDTYIRCDHWAHAHHVHHVNKSDV